MSDKLENIRDKWSKLKNTIEQTDNKKLYQFTKELNDALIGNINITLSISNLITGLENDLINFEKYVNENFGPNNHNAFIKDLIDKLNDRKKDLNNLQDDKIKESINAELKKISTLNSS